MESVCIVWVKGGNEMVFQELDYSHLDNSRLGEVNEIAWEWIPESNYTIKVEVATRCHPTKLVNKSIVGTSSCTWMGKLNLTEDIVRWVFWALDYKSDILDFKPVW